MKYPRLEVPPKIIHPKIRSIGANVKSTAAMPGMPILGEVEAGTGCCGETVIVEA